MLTWSYKISKLLLVVLSTALTDAKIIFPLILSASGATVNGQWETNLDPPASTPGRPQSREQKAGLAQSGQKEGGDYISVC